MINAHLNINLSFEQLVELVLQLSPSERLKLNEALWKEDMDIPKEHQDLVLDRIKKFEEKPDIMLDWEEVSKKLK